MPLRHKERAGAAREVREAGFMRLAKPVVPASLEAAASTLVASRSIAESLLATYAAPTGRSPKASTATRDTARFDVLAKAMRPKPD